MSSHVAQTDMVPQDSQQAATGNRPSESQRRADEENTLSFWLGDHLRDEWAKLTPDERLQRTLRLHRLRRELQGLAR